MQSPDGEEAFLYKHVDQQTGVFELGDLPGGIAQSVNGNSITVVTTLLVLIIESLRLKLHWESYLSQDKGEVRTRINHGRMMHEVFGEIVTSDDIESAVRMKVLEGKLPADEESAIRDKISARLSKPEIRDWFDKGNEVLNEASILMPGAGTKRPDRIILRDGKTIIVDFKFGEENPHYLAQIREYKHLLTEMGYANVRSISLVC